MEDKVCIKKISVRNLVEFILRSGDINNVAVLRDSTEAMQAGSKIHRSIQKERGKDYSSEVPIEWEQEAERDGKKILIMLEGRMDGVFFQEEREEPLVYIEEIKGVYMDVFALKEAIPVHLAQAKCYAAMYAVSNDLKRIGVRVTYCQIESMHTKFFEEVHEAEDLKGWLEGILMEYAKWAIWEMEWKEKRDESIRNMDFPFEYREGQKDLVKGVYLTILRKKKLFLQAPTGVGKTIATIFPTLKAMGEGLVERIFYLTAKTIARTVAEETFQLLIDGGVRLKLVTITAKDKICIWDKADCNPAICPRARGHYDRVNDAVFDMLNSEEMITRDSIAYYAKKHSVCPFETCLDAALWVDGIICDYNYVFDPNVYLRRFFQNEESRDYVFLIDEAHNLVERAREMYSATLYKHWFLETKKRVKDFSKDLAKQLDVCNKAMIERKRECEEFLVCGEVGDLVLHLMRLLSGLEEFMKEVAPGAPGFRSMEEVLEFYMNIRFFLFIYELVNDKYRIYCDYSLENEFRIRLQCMDPSENLKEYLKKGRSTVFFSATLLPVRYYKEQLGGMEEDYAVYAKSPFPSSNRLLMVARDVSTKYSRRNQNEYKKMASYIVDFVKGRRGNYLIFFPSYKMMEAVGDECGYITNAGTDPSINGEFIWKRQVANMSELDRETFLNDFEEQNVRTHIGLCVMGGIFGEGIDLRSNRLIGTVIVGTGLPMVGKERELFREYYDETKNKGFEFAYLYPGMNKVLQAAGRVIRTAEDKGAILLLDERFSKGEYRSLFPREWDSYHTVDRALMKKALSEFWNNGS